MSLIGAETFLNPLIKFLLAGAWDSVRDRLRDPLHTALNRALKEVETRHPDLGMMAVSGQALIKRKLPTADINPLIQLIDDQFSRGGFPTRASRIEPSPSLSSLKPLAERVRYCLDRNRFVGASPTRLLMGPAFATGARVQ